MRDHLLVHGRPALVVKNGGIVEQAWFEAKVSASVSIVSVVAEAKQNSHNQPAATLSALYCQCAWVIHSDPSA